VKATACLVAGLLAAGLSGCAGGRSTANTGHTAGPGHTVSDVSTRIGKIPGTMTSSLCTDNIYAGANGAAIFRTPQDIVVGPLRFGALREATGAALYAVHTSHGIIYGIKSPLSITGTSSPWIALRVVGDANDVKVDYSGVFASGPTDLSREHVVAALQTAVDCGNGSAGFVQYGGGFAWKRPTCAILQVFDRSGRLLAAKLVPFGRTSCP